MESETVGEGRVLFVGGHVGAQDWARRHKPHATMVEHLDVRSVRAGDTVIGTLPAHLIAQVCKRGARYLHLTMDLTHDERRRELTADDMDRMGAKLTEIRAEVVSPNTRKSGARTWVSRVPRWARSSAAQVQILCVVAFAVTLAVPGNYLVQLLDKSWTVVWSIVCGTETRANLLLPLSLDVVGFLVSAIVCIAVGLWAAHAIRGLLRPGASMDEKTASEVPPRKVVIMALSRLNAKNDPYDVVLKKLTKHAKADGFATLAASQGELRERDGASGVASTRRLADELREYNWIQNFRALKHHLGALEKVYLIVSSARPEPKQGSVDQSRDFAGLLRTAIKKELGADRTVKICYADGTEIIESSIAAGETGPAVDGVSFDSYEEAKHAFLMAMKAALRAKYKFKDICLEISAGTKPVSIAGAVVALNRDVLMSYVTNEGEPSFHDAQLSAEIAAEFVTG